MIDVAVTTADRYLHIAAVDVAGNIGRTANILIQASEVSEEYIKNVPPKTEMLQLADTEFVHAAGANKYYVKADGETAHELTAFGYIDGTVTEEYQIDWLQILSAINLSQEWYGVRIPKTGILSGDKTFANEDLETNASTDEMAYLNIISAVARRSNAAAQVRLGQQFTVDAANDGKQITVYPRAIAEFKGKDYWSDLSEDRSHALILIPDAVAPSISGITALESAGNIDMTEASKDFVVRAADSGSGVCDLTVTVTNLDNQMSRTYSSPTGELIITMAKDDYLFLGDFVVTAESTDNVGNRNLQGSDKLAFTLDARLQRSRQPYDGDFKAGDGAVLTVTTGGYADIQTI